MSDPLLIPDEVEEWKVSVSDVERMTQAILNGRLPPPVRYIRAKEMPSGREFECIDWYFSHSLSEIADYGESNP